MSGVRDRVTAAREFASFFLAFVRWEHALGRMLRHAGGSPGGDPV